MIIIRVITENLAEELVLLPAPAKAPSVDNEQQRAYNTFCNSLACQDEEVFIMTSPIEVNVTLYERNGVWTARGDYINPVTGKRCRPSKSLNLKVADNTKRKAQRILPEIKAQWEQELNANIVGDNPTFGQSVRLWLEAKSKSLRRTAASLLIAKGATAQQAQEFLGHEDITTTMNIYTRCFNETKKHTSEIMNSIYAD